MFFYRAKKQYQFYCQKVKKYSVKMEVSFPAAENFLLLYYLLAKIEHYFQTIHQAECQLEEFYIGLINTESYCSFGSHIIITWRSFVKNLILGSFNEKQEPILSKLIISRKQTYILIIKTLKIKY